MAEPRIILASASPRRRELLAALVPRFEVLSSGVEEAFEGEPGADAVRLALAKARAVAAGAPGAVVIGADTIVHDGARSYSKPESDVGAGATWRALRGREHRVYTGLAVVRDSREASALGVATVALHDLDDGAVAAYVASGRPLDKAGAYAIQDTDVPTVARLDGCYCNVVGLPLWRLARLLEPFAVACADPAASIPRCHGCPDARRRR